MVWLDWLGWLGWFVAARHLSDGSRWKKKRSVEIVCGSFVSVLLSGFLYVTLGKRFETVSIGRRRSFIVISLLDGFSHFVFFCICFLL